MRAVDFTVPNCSPILTETGGNINGKEKRKRWRDHRQRKDGRWEARYTVGRDPGTGKQIQRSVYGSSQQEVRKKLAQAVAAIDNGTYTVPQRMTLGQWLDIWTAEYLGDIKPKTAESY